MKYLIILLFPLIAFSYPRIPDSTMSPGHLCTKEDPDFKEYRYKEKIPYCERKVSTTLRKKIYASYGISWEDREHYTIDHIIPLSIGGSNSSKNLWPEHLYLKCKRGRLEFDLYLQMRDGVIIQKDAVQIILDSKFSN
jgi:hypothetical protein